MTGFSSDESINTAVEEKIKVKKPPLYKVILHNDDYTTMEFVVYILMDFFGKTRQDAIITMVDVHKKGRGIAGVYSKEIAEIKVYQVRQEADKNGFPLKCTMEKE
jgi:ATP-dependent Clp protease adaptor protein ClpS